MATTRSSEIINTPGSLKPDDPSAADAARERLRPRHRFPVFSSFQNLRQSAAVSGTKKKRKSKAKEQGDVDIAVRDAVGQDNVPVSFDPVIHLENATADIYAGKLIYRWAILYENQRGCSKFILLCN
jgi:hypothetical protein